MTAIRREPCSACPYRRDCPSGLWVEAEYAKLEPYDAETFAQPTAAFSCHATPEHLCHGWAVVHSNRGHEHELLALRILGDVDVPEPAVPMFSSGAEAAAHGRAAIDHPGDDARAAADRLVRKYHVRLGERYKATQDAPLVLTTDDEDRIAELLARKDAMIDEILADDQ